MIQTQKMILWANPREESFESAVHRGYDLMKVLVDFGPELSPNYLTVRRKRDAKIFDLSLNSFEQVVKKGIHKSGKIEFPDLGYMVSFFSSLVDDDAAGISLTIGVTNAKFNNRFVVGLPLTLPVYEDGKVRDKLIKVFKNCVEIFDPHWGCICNHINAQRFSGFLCDNLPTSIHWLNYFGENIIDGIGIQKLENTPLHTVEKLGNGYFIRLDERPIDEGSSSDLVLQETLNQILGFIK